jgi:hypothetical protein
MVLLARPGTAAAQENGITPASSPLFGPARLSASLAQTRIVEETPTEFGRPAPPTGRGPLIPLYVAFGTLQALDVHSTLRAINSGAGVERNPVVKGFVDRPAMMIAVKGGVTTATILLADRVRVHNRVGAIILMAALDSAYAIVVAHNYSIP